MPPKKAPEQLASVANIKGTKEFEKWLDDLVELTRYGTRTQLIKNALQDVAAKHGLFEPMPKR